VPSSSLGDAWPLSPPCCCERLVLASVPSSLRFWSPLRTAPKFTKGKRTSLVLVPPLCCHSSPTFQDLTVPPRSRPSTPLFSPHSPIPAKWFSPSCSRPWVYDKNPPYAGLPFYPPRGIVHRLFSDPITPLPAFFLSVMAPPLNADPLLFLLLGMAVPA